MLRELNIYGWIALSAVLVGGICWGLAGLFNAFLVTSLFGNFLGRLIYIGIGVGAGYLCYLIYQEKLNKAPII